LAGNAHGRIGLRRILMQRHDDRGQRALLLQIVRQQADAAETFQQFAEADVDLEFALQFARELRQRQRIHAEFEEAVVLLIERVDLPCQLRQQTQQARADVIFRSGCRHCDVADRSGGRRWSPTAIALTLRGPRPR
jgi:hypothetical protein